MKRFFTMSTGLVTCLVALSCACIAQTNPWNGSWKMNRSSFKYDGPTMTVMTDSEGYTISREGNASPKVVCDGKAHETPGGMLTCTKAGAGYEMSLAKDGKTIAKSTSSISADGRKLTIKRTLLLVNDKPSTMTVSYERQSDGQGMNGAWKAVNFAESQDTGVMTIKVTGDSIAFTETDTPKVMVCKLDGTPTKSEQAGGAVSATKVDARTMKVAYMSADGKVRRENTFVLSPDGTSISETDVTPSPSASKMTVTLNKM